MIKRVKTAPTIASIICILPPIKSVIAVNTTFCQNPVGSNNHHRKLNPQNGIKQTIQTIQETINFGMNEEFTNLSNFDP